MHVGHNSTDGGLTGKESCEQLRETIEISIEKFKPQSCSLQNNSCEKPFGRDQHNTEINIFNDALENISLEMDGSFLVKSCV